MGVAVPTVEFFVPGKPTAQPRPRITTAGGFPRAYVPGNHPVHSWRERAALAARENRPETWPIRKPHPVRISIEFRALKPASMAKNRTAWTTKPDRDNMEKALLDALEGIVMESDSQVVGGEVTKRYHTQPGALVRVEWDSLF
jgi:Holliday junction resolvase RusA-like endonuclease